MKTTPSEALARLKGRIEVALEWYRDCIVCDETLYNIQRDLDSLWRETRSALPSKLQGFRLRASFEGTTCVVRMERFDYLKAAS